MAKTLYKRRRSPPASVFGAEARENKLGAGRMRLWVRFFRGLSLVAAVYGGAILGAAIGSVALPGTAVAQSASSIVVQGNRRVDAETIRSYFRASPGQRLDAVAIDEAWKALMGTGLFEDVKISPSGGRVVVTVIEAPVINRIQFEGNRQVKDEQLAQEIQSKPRGAFSRQLVRADVQRVIDIYRASGRYDVRVDPKVIELPNGRVDLVFEVTEGRKTTVKRINFVGNRFYSAGKLSDVIKTTKTSILTFFKSTDNYDGDRVEADKDLLRRFYLKNGFADIRIVSAVSEFDPAQNGFVVTFVIDEGERYRFGIVDIQSNVRDVNPAALRSFIRTSAGSIYDAEAVEKSVEQMTIELAKRGYAFAQVRPRGDRNFETRTVDLFFVIDQGARAYIERINVRGNTRTRDYVIRREFDVAEGDAYNHALIDRAERRLKNLSYFKTVKITSEPGSAPDRVIVNVDVEEQSTGEFSVAGGYSTSDGFMAEVGVGERNLLGRGQYAKASVQYGQRARGFELSFVEPYLMGYRLAFGVDVFAKTNLSSVYQSYESSTVGGGFRLGIPITDEVSTQLRYTIYQQEITLSDVNNCFPASDGDRAESSTLYPSGALDPQCGQCRCDADFARRIHACLQYLGQQQEPDQGTAGRIQAGLCRCRRRRELHPQHRGQPVLLQRLVRSRGALSSSRAVTSPRGVAKNFGCSTTSSWDRISFVALQLPAWGHATRPSVRPMMRSAAPCTGARLLNCNIRCSSRRRTSA